MARKRVGATISILTLAVPAALLLFGARGSADDAQNVVGAVAPADVRSPFPIMNPFVSREITLAKLSAELQRAQRAVKQALDVDSISLWGGTARVVTAHALQNEPLKLRDVDTGIFVGHPLATADWDRIERVFTKSFGREAVHLPDRNEPLVKGEYTVEVDTDGLELDISVITSPEVWKYRGLFDFDRMKINLNVTTSLEEAVEKIRSDGYEAVIAQNLVVDPDGGFKTWQTKAIRYNQPWLKTFTWDAMLIRSVHTFAKLDLFRLPDYLVNDIEAKRLSDELNGRRAKNHSVASLLLRILNGPNPTLELAEVIRLQGLKYFAPELQAKLSGLTPPRISQIMMLGQNEKVEISPSVSRYLKLTDLVSSGERKLLQSNLGRVDPRYVPQKEKSACQRAL